MAVTYVNETNASDLDSGQSTSALALAIPSGAARDDLLLAFVHTNNTKGLTLPAGWTSLVRLNGYSFLDLWVAYRVMQAGDTSFTWTQTTADLIAGKMIAVRGTSPDRLVTQSSAYSGITTGLNIIQYPVPDDGLNIVGCALDASTAGGYTWSADTAGFTAHTAINRSYRIMQAFRKAGSNADELQTVRISSAVDRPMGVVAVGCRPIRTNSLFFGRSF